MTDILILQLTVIASTTAVLVTSLIVGARYLESRRGRVPPPVSDAELVARLERIEQVVESTAIEMERVAEANRFMARLLSERTGVPAPGQQPPRAITPH